MCDQSLMYLREQRKRGKSYRPKRPHEPGRNVRDVTGHIVAIVRGPRVTDADVDQARALVAWIPDYTAAIGGAP